MDPMAMQVVAIMMAVLKIMKTNTIHHHLKSKTSIRAVIILLRKIIHGKSLKRHLSNCLKITNSPPKKLPSASMPDTKLTNMAGHTNRKIAERSTNTVVLTVALKAT